MINEDNFSQPDQPIVFISFSPTSKLKKMLDKAGVDIYIRGKESKSKSSLSQQTFLTKRLSH